MKIKNSKSFLIRGSGVDLKYYKITEEPCLEKTIVAFAGRLIKDKGVFDFLDAAMLILNKRDDVEFHLFGEIDPLNRSSLSEEDLIEYKSLDSIRFRGHVSNLSEELVFTNLLVLPSYREGLPKVLLEGAALGRAIVTTDVPGCRDAILEGKTGLLVPVRDVAALAAAIEHLLDNPEVRSEMGHSGRQFVEHNFTIQKVVDMHMDVYRDASNEK